jgi:hypothetical protein
MSSNTKHSESVGIWFLVGLAFMWIVGAHRGPDTTTVYQESCTPDRCSASIRSHFTAVPEAQAVLYSDDAGIVSRLERCAVVDGSNWSCVDHETAYFMAHGEYSLQGATVPGMRPVSWWRWRYLRARGALD